jgi:hypothetical protein
MARFDHKARVLASLNHPNIATIYGLEDRAIVMELVEGQTLAERILRVPRKPLEFTPYDIDLNHLGLAQRTARALVAMNSAAAAVAVR